ncbi:MAG: DUF1080 domain-containing protein [Aureliella sp.]
MRRVFVIFVALLCPLTAFAQNETYQTPEDAAKNPDFSIQGEYVGLTRAMQVIALGDGEFEAVIYQGGLPGAGWDKSPPRRLEVIAEDVADLAESNEMKRVERASPTLGKKPPAGAVVLFDGSNASLEQHWRGGKMTKNGLLMQGVTSKVKFQDFTLHLEFRTPFKPTARGQQRGNSGVYYQGRYETQVLDSFGLEGKMNETGGIYSISDPSLNMCLPPLQWQTYDGEFTAAKFDDSGKKISDARLTVRLNGVVVQQDVLLTHSTTAAPVKEGPEPGPIFLQDHKNPVVFRNIWVMPRDVAKEARRAIVPGFERFYAQASQPSAEGGQVLISELGCVSCHAPGADVAPRQAPILTDVGARVRPDHLLAFIKNPHHVKGGTAMPDLLGKMPEAERTRAAEAIASFLAMGSSLADRVGNPRRVRTGKDLFHNIGCTACHAHQDGVKVNAATTVPLGQVEAKYTLDSLAAFLKNPHTIRPSGRMPDFNLSEEQAADVATYLLRDTILGDGALNTRASFYEGSWETLPDFTQLQPYRESEVYGLDILASGRKNGFGVVFETTFVAPKNAVYTFRISSDDGSRLIVDGQRVAENDGVHPKSMKQAKVELTAGPHSLRVEYFENGGEEVLELDVKGGGLSWSAVESLVTLDPDAKPSPLIESVFEPRAELVDAGRKLFKSVGCASCHVLERDGSRVTATLSAPTLTSLAHNGLSPNEGCLAEDVPVGLPDYELTYSQRAAILAALKSGPPDNSKEPEAAEQLIHRNMVTMNCYACHSRNRLGGPEDTRDLVFKTTIKEMGDEGRLPPPLTGVGDKLKPEYIDQVLDRGADERPYMLVNMPGFGKANTEGLRQALVAVDQRSEADIPPLELTEGKIKAAGRKLVGSKGLSCVKCHVFGKESTPGIQAIDMQRMASRLRKDWFHRYLISPETYRPGTRMPASFKDGKSAAADVLQGHPAAQVEAMWRYLLDGDKARKPEGIGREPIELVANERPVIYRNFISGLSPRAIAIGYPENVNLAWDAEAMSLSLVWKGSFIDASKHWIGRGPGDQTPLGDEILGLENSPPFAVLASVDADWPAKPARELGYRFKGYRLDESGLPTFLYSLSGVGVEDTPVPVTAGTSNVGFVRTLRCDVPDLALGTLGSLVFRAAEGKKIEKQGEGWFNVDGLYSIKLPGADVVTVGGKQQLRLQVEVAGGKAEIVEEIKW